VPLFRFAENSKEYSCFNSSFINAWKDTHNYKIWSSGLKSGIFQVNPGHPFTGQLSMADMKLKLTQGMLNTERGKKINQTVSQTSKAVGGAITSARSWLYSQFSNFDKKSADSLLSLSLSNLLKSSNQSSDLNQVKTDPNAITDI
jgi:late secretory pathway protein AVL9 homolog